MHISHIISNQSCPVINHTIRNVRDISVTMAILQSYIQELVQGIYVNFASYKLRLLEHTSSKAWSINVP